MRDQQKQIAASCVTWLQHITGRSTKHKIGVRRDIQSTALLIYVVTSHAPLAEDLRYMVVPGNLRFFFLAVGYSGDPA